MSDRWIRWVLLACLTVVMVVLYACQGAGPREFVDDTKEGGIAGAAGSAGSAGMAGGS